LVRQAATQTIATIKGQVPIANFADFEAACHCDSRVLSRLKNMCQCPHIKSITPTTLKATIDRLGLDVAMNDDGTLIFDPKKKWVFFRLLDDGYLNSPMTGANYEANSKRLL
jgi:hypothetical protein